MIDRYLEKQWQKGRQVCWEQQRANNWLNAWSAWAEQKGHDISIEGYEPVPLIKILEVQSCLSEIFACILLTSSHMIFLVKFGINKHL